MSCCSGRVGKIRSLRVNRKREVKKEEVVCRFDSRLLANVSATNAAFH